MHLVPHLDERMPLGERRIRRRCADEAHQLSHVWQSPVAGGRPVRELAVDVPIGQSVAQAQGLRPIHLAKTAGSFEPDETGEASAIPLR